MIISVFLKVVREVSHRELFVELKGFFFSVAWCLAFIVINYLMAKSTEWYNSNNISIPRHIF